MKTFKFENKEVRIKILDDEIWFVAKDVTDILGYGITCTAIKHHVDDEDTRIDEEIPLINESGLYNLIFASNLLLAMKFKKWVISEVIPIIRKDIYKETCENINKKDELMERNSKYIELLNKLIECDAKHILYLQKLIECNNEYIKRLEQSISKYDEVIYKMYKAVTRIKNTH